MGSTLRRNRTQGGPREGRSSPRAGRRAGHSKETEKDTQTLRSSFYQEDVVTSARSCEVEDKRIPKMSGFAGLSADTLSVLHSQDANILLADHMQFFCGPYLISDLELSHPALPLLMYATCNRNKGRTFKWHLLSFWE